MFEETYGLPYLTLKNIQNRDKGLPLDNICVVLQTSDDRGLNIVTWPINNLPSKNRKHSDYSEEKSNISSTHFRLPP